MFGRFLDWVIGNDLAEQCREGYYEQAGNFKFPAIPREHQSYIDCNIFFEILCYGAFALSIAAVPYCIRKRLFTSVFDRPSWACIDDGISDALCKEIGQLDSTFPDQFHVDATESLVQAAKIGFIEYMQDFTDGQAGADLIALHRQAKSPSNFGCVLFSERMSQTVDPDLGERWGASKMQWIPFGKEILSETQQIARSVLSEA